MALCWSSRRACASEHSSCLDIYMLLLYVGFCPGQLHNAGRSSFLLHEPVQGADITFSFCEFTGNTANLGGSVVVQVRCHLLCIV